MDLNFASGRINVAVENAWKQNELICFNISEGGFNFTVGLNKSDCCRLFIN